MSTCMNFRDMWLSAIVSLVCCRFWKPHCAGEVLPKFSIDTIMLLFLQKRLLHCPPSPLPWLRAVPRLPTACLPT
jgi:hypothetical protein